MIRPILVATLALVVGCPQPLPPLPPGPIIANGLLPVGVCGINDVLALIQSGQLTFEDIAVSLASQCGSVAAADIEALVSAWLNPPAGATAPAAITPVVAAKLRMIKHKAAKP